MSTTNVGTLTSAPAHFLDSLVPTEPTDVYKFSIGGTTPTNVNITTHDRSGNALNTPGLRLFEDSNHNGQLDSADKAIGFDVAGVGLGIDRSINQLVGPGTYFAQVSPRFANTTEPYSIDLSTTAPKQPANLIGVKFSFGDLISRGIPTDEINQNIGTNNTSDFYSVHIRDRQILDIKMDGLRADADFRVIEDKNHNNIVDAGEEIARSAKFGTAAESLKLASASVGGGAIVNAPGDYLIQVYQFTGNTNYHLQVAATNVAT